MVSKLDSVLGLVAVGGLVAFWVPPIWDYGYVQIALGQVSAALFGAFAVRFVCYQGGAR